MTLKVFVTFTLETVETKLRHRFFLNVMNKFCTVYYEDFPLYIESGENGSCH